MCVHSEWPIRFSLTDFLGKITAKSRRVTRTVEELRGAFVHFPSLVTKYLGESTYTEERFIYFGP